MKKLLLIFMLLLTLSLSACSNEAIEERYVIYNDDNNTFISCIVEDTLEDCYTVEIYTQEEVDELVQQILQITQSQHERILELESKLGDFERFEYEDLLELMLYMENEFGDELEYYIDEKLTDFEQIDTLDYDIQIMSIALIDIMILEYEQIEVPTEEETLAYEIMLLFRQMIYNEVE